MPPENAKTPAGELPPLELLRSFEAAARRLSFTLAAGELHLTQSAVSRQGFSHSLEACNEFRMTACKRGVGSLYSFVSRMQWRFP